MVTRPVIVIGGGGHGRVVIEALLRSGIEILGVVDPNPEVAARLPSSIRWLGDDDVLRAYPPDRCTLANGVGSVGDTRRLDVFAALKIVGYDFLALQHPTAVIAGDAVVEEGSQVMAGAILQPGVRIGVNTIVNTRAAVDHDCRIGEHAHIAPGAVLCGDVEVGDQSHIGAAAVVIQGIRIGKRCMIGAGAVIRRDIADNTIVYDERRRQEEPRR